MDKKFGAPWHVVVGRAFSYEVTYEVCLSHHMGMTCTPRCSEHVCMHLALGNGACDAALHTECSMQHACNTKVPCHCMPLSPIYHQGCVQFQDRYA